MPPGIVSMRCFLSVGLFSRTKEIPAALATLRKRMGGGVLTAKTQIAQRNRAPANRLFRRANLRLFRLFRLLLLISLPDFLILRHGRPGLLGIAARAVRVR